MGQHGSVGVLELVFYKSVRFDRIGNCPRRNDIKTLFIETSKNTHPTALRIGLRMLTAYGLVDMFCSEASDESHRQSRVCEILDAHVHSSAGIVALTRTSEILEDTLDHTDPERHRYKREQNDQRMHGSSVYVAEPTRNLQGRFLSLLLGNHENHFHWLLMNIGRLALLRASDLDALDGILIPAGLSISQLEMLGLVGLPRRGPLLPIADTDGLFVSTLVLPWNAVSGSHVNPATVAFWRNFALEYLGAYSKSQRSRQTIYIDRRASPLRPLLNEDEIITTLASQGVEPVRLETRPLVEQARLFQAAATILAPHGAGLANLVFAQPGTRVIELMPSGAVNWCYRHLAAACGHDCDCVIGRSVPDGSVAPIWRPWLVSPTHVLAALHSPPSA